MKILVLIYRSLIAYLGITLNGLIGSILYLISFGRLRRWNAEVLTPFFGKWILKLIGIEAVLPDSSQIPAGPVMYIFNHNSFLDIFLLPMLKLPNTVPLLSTRTRKIIPLYLANLGMGAKFIPFKDRPEARLGFLKALSKWLERKEASLVCAPEGVHRFRHGIGKFNRGIFHAAMESRTTIAPLFFKIPKESNPLETHSFRNGRVEVSVLPPISTANWTVETLDEEIQRIRNIYVQKFNQEFQAGIQ
ncbi:MAG: 1-acyl-sn-glycerol-3-phosphate acyltransferase [Bdellovibrionales bacterium]|nr:1-acyl-sn-glycerol-3-phosphate acyltransferase [Bdellovibrionales bacterium]